MQDLIVLHCQPVAEQDWLLDCFTQQRGRVKLILKRPQFYPDLFTHYQGAWQNDNDWPSIKAWQSLEAWPLSANALFCGLYLNELLSQLLPPAEAFPKLFVSYQQSVQALAAEQWPEPWLRLFEWQLLTTLGYGFAWHTDSQNFPIKPELNYTFEVGAGFNPSLTGISGELLLAFAQGSKELKVWRMAKQVFRQALDEILPRPLCSRELFIKV